MVEDLPMLVEYGDDGPGGRYTYAKDDEARYLYPRPFIGYTIASLESVPMHKEAMKIGLNRHGIPAK